MDYYSGREVQEHYWMHSGDGARRPSEVVYRGPYSNSLDGEHFFQSVMVMCVMYFVARLFFNGLVGLLILGLTVALVLQLLDSVSSSLRPQTGYFSRSGTVY